MKSKQHLDMIPEIQDILESVKQHKNDPRFVHAAMRCISTINSTIRTQVHYRHIRGEMPDIPFMGPKGIKKK